LPIKEDKHGSKDHFNKQIESLRVSSIEIKLKPFLAAVPFVDVPFINIGINKPFIFIVASFVT
jgi:hypothetical protein